jgi:hypothetical protein
MNQKDMSSHQERVFMTERKCKCGMFFIPVVGNQDECQSCMISPRRRVEGDPARDISEKERARIKSTV